MISVCVITYNQENFISECLESILKQDTDYDYEIVIGEDGSSDGTRKVIEEFRDSYPEKIKLLPSEGNKGMLPNFVDTLKNCKEKYVAICEGDDYWTDTRKLQKQVDFLEANKTYSICFTNTRYKTESSGEFKDVITCEKDTLTIEDLLEKNYVATQTVLFRNNNITVSKEFESLKVGDWPLHILNAQFGKIKHLDDFTAVYRIHDSNNWMGKPAIQKQKEFNEAIEYLYNHIRPEFKHLVKAKLLKEYYSIFAQLMKKGFKSDAMNYYTKMKEIPGAHLTKEGMKMKIKRYLRV